MTLKVNNLNTSDYRYKTYKTHGSQAQINQLEKNLSLPSKSSVSFKSISKFYKIGSEIPEYEKILTVARRQLGDVADNLLEDLFSRKGVKGKKIFIEGTSLRFNENTFLKSLLDSAAFPLVKLPFLLADFVLKIGKKIPGIRKYAGNAYDSKFLSGIRLQDRTTDDINSLKGILTATKNIVEDAGKKGGGSLTEMVEADKNPKIVNDALFKKLNQGFDSKHGNYNTVHERSLNRLVTGMASAFFLADDAYNLSVLCGDKPGESDKEKKARFKQEVSRVGANAYLQLITLGALTGLVNKSGALSALVTGVTVLFSETFSRATNHKPIFFLSPKRAKEMNKKASEKKEKEVKNNNNKPKELPARSNISMQGLSPTITLKNTNLAPTNLLNMSFKGEKDDDKDDDKNDKIENKEVKNKNKDDKKTLLSFKSLTKAVVGLAAAGLSLAYLRHNPKMRQMIPFGETIDRISDYWNKNLYPRLTKKDFEISTEDFLNVMNKLDKSGIKTSDYREIVGDALNKPFIKLKKGGIGKVVQVDTKMKILVDTITQPFKFAWGAVTLPYKIVKSVINVPINAMRAKVGDSEKSVSVLEKKFIKFSDELFGKSGKAAKTQTSEDILAMVLNKLTKKAHDVDASLISQDEFKEIANSSILKSFNETSKSNYSNADLAMLTKMAASTVTSAFLVADNYNMVMLKSDGEDKEGAKQKAQERVVQRISSLFYQTLMMKWFNSTFSNLYHSSLPGMSAVSGTSQVSMEVLTRASIGMPVSAKSYDELAALDEKNRNRKGLSGKYFNFMSKLTGKKPLSKKEKTALNVDKQAVPFMLNSGDKQILSAETNLLSAYLSK